MAQQKQREQPILIDGKNIFTYCFQQIQRLQPILQLMVYEISWHNRNNANKFI